MGEGKRKEKEEEEEEKEEEKEEEEEEIDREGNIWYDWLDLSWKYAEIRATS